MSIWAPLILVSLAAVCAAPAGRTATLSGLFNTGVNETGGLLPAGAPDPHWKLVRSADAAAPGPVAWVVHEGFPIPPWIANGPVSKWIGPQADQSGGNAPGNYTYRLAFDLTGFDPATAVITGRWSSDNSGIEVRVNGLVSGLTFDGDFSAFSSEFILRTGFVEGLNTLDFVVNNAGDGINPTGFRAELRGTADFVAPPGTPPRITRQPASVTVPFKDPASFSVGVHGSRPLHHQWRRDNLPIDGATNATLLIPFAGVAEGGSYDVVVSNSFGTVTSASASLQLAFPNPTQLTREPPGPSSRRTGMVLSEIHYHPAPTASGPGLEFIELYNSNPFFEDLGGWRLTGEVDFTFPPGTVLGGKNRLVVAADPAAVSTAHGITNVVGGWTGRLANEGGTIRLRKASGAVLLEVAFSDQAPWPLAAAGSGHSLVLTHPSLGEADPHAWSASAFIGGSPGVADPLPESPLDNLRINEVFAAPDSGQPDWIELRNASARPVDLSGCVLRAPPLVDGFTVPAGTVLGGGGFVVFSGNQTGVSAARTSGRLWLFDPDQRRVLDAVQLAPASPGFSLGPTPWRRGALRELTSPTPNAPNTPPRLGDVVISEIHFRPLSGDDRDEFVELHHRGSNSVDLGGWRFVDGIDLELPAGTTIAPGAFLVVSRDAAHFRATHPAWPSATVVGDFEGNLSDRGERLALARPIAYPNYPNPIWVTVAEAQYRDGSPASRWADGGGSSLELVDLRADPMNPDHWADSDETGKADWTLVEATGVLESVHPGVPDGDQLQVMLLGAGEALVDDLEVRVGNGNNRVSNGRFETSVSGWSFQGTHRLSRRESGAGFGSAASLRLVATERGDHVVNRARTALSAPLSAGQIATIRARVRWLTGHPEILFRLRGGGLEASARLTTPDSCGTPGAPNRRTVANAGPAFDDVTHRPVLPEANQPVRVLARVTDPDGVDRVSLRYRRDPDREWVGAPMVDDGTGPDAQAGDGLFTGMIPGQAAGTLVAFHLEAVDSAAPVAGGVFPAGAPDREALVRWGEPAAGGSFGGYRIWLTKANHDFWAGREAMSNEDVEVTFVYGAHRVIHNAGAHFSGSSYSSPGYNSPTGNLCGYDVNLPKSDRFLGGTRLTLDWPIRDNTNQREQLMYWFLEQYGLPNMYRRYVHLYVNGLRRGTIYDDVQQPGGDTVEEWFPDDADGTLWKTDCWNEFDNGGGRIDPCILNTLEPFTTAGGEKNPARYRWNWRPRAAGQTANDFRDLFALVDAVNPPTDYVRRVEEVVDVDHWMRTFAMNDLASFWDAFGNPNAKNTFLYKPERDRWKLMSWDFDVGLGVFNDPPDAALFEVTDPTLTRMYRTAAFVRRYWAALEEALNGWFRVGPGTRIDALLDAKHAAFRAENLALADPAGIKSWITQRRAFLQAQLHTVRSGFAITSPADGSLTSQTPLILRGTAPVSVRTLRVNGVEQPVTWNTVTGWEMRVPLAAGTNVLTLTGDDYQLQPVAGANAQLTVYFTGTPPPVPVLRINEWMAANQGTLADPADGAFDDWFELYNPGEEAVSLTGWRLTDSLDDPTRFVVPAGFSVGPRDYLLVWADGQPDQSRLDGNGDLHVNFQLARSGEAIALFDPLGRLVDQVQFGPQAVDISEGRWPDGAPAPCFVLPQPTPGAANPLPPTVQAELRLLGLEVDAAGGVTLRWSSLPGRRYRIRHRPEVTAAGSETIGEVTAEGSIATWREASTPASEQRYYQVILIP
ncbi:MAG: lamin tail domain-containing protein [Limisphaerales bacterium]